MPKESLLRNHKSNVKIIAWHSGTAQSMIIACSRCVQIGTMSKICPYCQKAGTLWRHVCILYICIWRHYKNQTGLRLKEIMPNKSNVKTGLRLKEKVTKESVPRNHKSNVKTELAAQRDNYQKKPCRGKNGLKRNKLVIAQMFQYILKMN